MRRVVVVTTLVLAFVSTACGSGDAPLTAPARLPDNLVPAVLPDGVTLGEYKPAR